MNWSNSLPYVKIQSYIKRPARFARRSIKWYGKIRRVGWCFLWPLHPPSYMLEILTLTKELEKRIQALDMRCFCKLLNISYVDHISNEAVHTQIQYAIGCHDDLLTMVKNENASGTGASHIPLKWQRKVPSAQLKGLKEIADRRKIENQGLDHSSFTSSLSAVAERSIWREIDISNASTIDKVKRLKWNDNKKVKIKFWEAIKIWKRVYCKRKYIASLGNKFLGFWEDPFPEGCWWKEKYKKNKSKKGLPLETKNTQDYENRRLGLIESLHMQHCSLRGCKSCCSLLKMAKLLSSSRLFKRMGSSV